MKELDDQSTEREVTPPVALPRWPGRRYVDLIAASLCEVGKRDDAVFRMMALAIADHLAESTRKAGTGRATDEALDSVLSLISAELQRQVGRADRQPVTPRP